VRHDSTRKRPWYRRSMVWVKLVTLVCRIKHPRAQFRTLTRPREPADVVVDSTNYPPFLLDSESFIKFKNELKTMSELLAYIYRHATNCFRCGFVSSVAASSASVEFFGHDGIVFQTGSGKREGV
jgi:hypothetical protein